MPVQQHVLNWLYSVLTSEYHDVNRCYEDVARVLTKYNTLAPRTDVHTFPNGASALLVHLSGTIPVNFRGATYRFPLSIWVPHAYPREPPLIYVTPTETMVVRPGQHVDPQGQVYHPYLVGWAQFWDKSSLQDFLAILSDVFAKEPPVISRQSRQPAQSQQPVATPPPVPPLPPEMNARSASSSNEPRPPPPPPKSPPESSGGQQGPPLPPFPPNATSSSSRTPSRYDSAPPLPPQAQSNAYSNQQPQQVNHPPGGQFDRQHPGAATLHMQPLHQMVANDQRELPPYNQAQWQPEQQAQPGPGSGSVPGPGQWSGPDGRQVPPAQQQQQPPPDLLVDDPLTLDIPTQSTVAAPPIPPNPQKDALLRQLAQILASMRQSSRQQNESSLAGLEAQRSAMLSALSALQSESGQLTQLSNVLSSNANILHEALRKADGVIEGSKNHPQADIDELLVAPTVVSNQLYNLVAEERALGDAIFMLGRAVERGRISPAVFAKMTRSLAREWYLKKALARKIGQGMGMVG